MLPLKNSKDNWASSLLNLPVLVLDIQASGSSPKTGRIMEIGWAVTRARDSQVPRHIESHLIYSPENLKIPPYISRITGLSTEDLAQGISITQMLEKLNSTVSELRHRHPNSPCVAVIHYARYEQSFLHPLYAFEGSEDGLPFEIICTHEISKRLLSGLPRKGLRAVAGYFGHGVAQVRRCRHHVKATASVWHHLAQLLVSDGVNTVEQLLQWLHETNPSSRQERIYPMDKVVRETIPKSPGVYRMRRANGTLLYVGKATCLRTRVHSYFRKSSHHAEHILEMLSQAKDIDVTQTPTVLEAALKETDEIKQYCPPYNKALMIGQRQLVYYSRDFSEKARIPDEKYRIGPVPESSGIDLFHGMIESLKMPPDRVDPHQVLQIPKHRMPDSDCVVCGWKQFRSKYVTLLSHPFPPGKLLAMGAIIWKQRNAESPDIESETAESDDSDLWNPERVLRHIESSLCRGAQLIRRSRWFALLSEATVVWQPRNLTPTYRILAFHHGRVVFSDTADRDQISHLPQCHSLSNANRWHPMELATYDRLQVLTTELRRLITGNRPVWVHVSPRVCLGSRQLERVLFWI